MRLPGIEEKYEILRTLGEGGMGVVYLALQKPINRKVAIKSIAPYLARDPAIRERFSAEAGVLARLNHPNIVTLYDYIEEENALYLIMEYVEGQALSEMLKAGPLPLDLIDKYFTQVLEAFAYAHGEGVIHRDIKPANIMITAGGRVKILDFGVARLLQTDHSITRTGMRLGTLLYMSPEQVKGEKDIDHRSDIYSLGVVLYEMLLGKPPYPTDISEFDLSLKIVKEPLFDLSRPPAEIPHFLVEVILKATEKDPAFRYPTCETFLDDFKSAFQQKLPPSPPTQIQGFPGKEKTALGSRKKIALLIGIAVLFVLLPGIGIFFYLSQNKRAISEAPPPLDSTSITDTVTFFSEDTSSFSPSEEFGPVPSPFASEKSAISSEKPPLQKPISVPTSTSHPKKPSFSESKPTDTFSLSPPSAQPVFSVEIVDFRPSSLAQAKAKGTLVVKNTGEVPAHAVQVVLFFLDKNGQLRDTDTLELPEIAASQAVSHPVKARVDGIKKIQAEVISHK
ncbi:MAG: hypothetical protein KatS3mg025_0531 [Bacteroidia bacterium]|jgi:serine/threonine protein kinase|nr:MAG: hypothetical protein KatS3mg025_0531 [Bacteroidia bacterium]